MGKTLGIALIAPFLALSGAFAGQKGADDEALAHYAEATAGYATLHRSVERQVPPLEISDNAGKIYQAVAAMAAAMRAARPHAANGDIFTPAVAELLRRRVQQALGEGGTAADLRQWTADEDDEPLDVATPVANASFSWAWPNYMPPTVLALLPPVPRELEYRFVGTDLVLIDMHANLVVDVLPHAIRPAPSDGFVEVD